MTVPPEVAAGRDLLVAALQQIELHPETWEQGAWRCGTSFCLAGWMAELSPDVDWVDRLGSDLTCGMGVGQWAEQTLGLETKWCTCGCGTPLTHALFYGNNSLDDLRAGVKAVLNDEPVGPAIERARAERP